MKHLFILKHVVLTSLVSLLTYVSVQATDWRNGRYFTPKGDLHILVIFANSECDRIDGPDELGCNGNLTCETYYYNKSVPAWATNQGYINSSIMDINNGLVNNQVPYLADDDFNLSSYYKNYELW